MRTTRKIGGALACLALLTAGLGAQDPETDAEGKPQQPPAADESDPHGLGCPLTRAELVATVHEARTKGFAHLLATQNADGSWGSHDPKAASMADFGFQLRNRGSQDGVRLACTAIGATALLDKREPRTADEEQALKKAIAALLGTEKFAYHLGESFNTWGYGYKLDFLTHYLQTPEGEARRTEIEPAAKVCIDGLLRYQQADGGWNYYAGPLGDGESMSFNTGNFGRALLRAKKVGLDVPKGCAEDAVKLLRRMRTAKGGFIYDARFLRDPGSVNELSAGSRTVSCALALHDAGVYGAADLAWALRIFDEGENYLEDGRKLIQPHTAVHQISGYFFFYGYCYAAEVAARLGDAVAPERWDRLAWTMVRTQEDDGSWWDTPAADYGDKWGTGFALQTLERYLAHVEASASTREQE